MSKGNKDVVLSIYQRWVLLQKNILLVNVSYYIVGR